MRGSSPSGKTICRRSDFACAISRYSNIWGVTTSGMARFRSAINSVASMWCSISASDVSIFRADWLAILPRVCAATRAVS